ncbi:uncharacterized protein YtpQ (UPF0354 family) [Anaerosolibacter carboniphilus]|uniref:Uncharacterized protein YtpQ (UPF0354 family) n=1 Tax=Anaerosolibacter carboniphilus TaxID=1417629 RepID=A0A841L7J0_9FIRM|nr:hypothetical protein [Anaerosolibacter carboniphilus]MBB6219032.1 uncharacterized protein YtpQ (UPF0354 family) [Anaerosolibacter carboniphilus]
MDKDKMNEDSKRIWKGATDVFIDLERLRMVILNIKISVAKVNTEEHRALSTIADYLAESIDRIEEKTKEIRELSKSIGKEINK